MADINFSYLLDKLYNISSESVNSEYNQFIHIMMNYAREVSHDPEELKKISDELEFKFLIQIIQKNNINIDSYDEKGDKNTILHLASILGNLEIVKILLENHADPNISDKYNNDALNYAIISKNPEIVKILLENHAELNIKDEDKILELAYLSGNKQLLNIIMENDEELEWAIIQSENKKRFYLRVEENRKSPFDKKFNDETDFSFEKTDNEGINDQDYDGYTKLHRAVERESFELTKILLDLEANINLPNARNGKTALHIAAEKGNLNIIRYLVNHGANIDIFDKNYETALYIATKKNHLDIVNYLSEVSSKLNLLNQKDQKDFNITYIEDNSGISKLVNEANINENKTLNLEDKTKNKLEKFSENTIKYISSVIKKMENHFNNIFSEELLAQNIDKNHEKSFFARTAIILANNPVFRHNSDNKDMNQK